jgi:hypothetical protein
VRREFRATAPARHPEAQRRAPSSG